MIIDLTTAQREAVFSGARELLVIAGAGSGKTRVLTERVVHLLADRGVSPSELLVLTFTRKAAAEMIGRIQQALPHRWSGQVEQALRSMLIGTFHSVALQMLRTHGDAIGYRPGEITVIDLKDADLLLRQVCRDLGYLRGTGWKDGLSWAKVSRGREELYTRGEQGHPVIGSILVEYHARLFAMNALDFGMILRDCNRLLSACPDIREMYQRRIRHVLVDELQDADTVQYNLHDWFAPPAEFFGVGDRRQSIYGFRGARPDLMTDRHRDAEIIDLQQCFRCGERITTAANRLIAHNKDKLAKPMISVTGRESIVDLAAGRSEQIRDRIMWLHVRGYAWSEIAVLARKHRTLKHLAERLDEFGSIPYWRVGHGFDICETDEFLNLLAVFRLMVNPHDELAFLRLLDEFGISQEEYAAIRCKAAREGWSEWQAFIDGHDNPPEPADIIHGFHTWHDDPAKTEYRLEGCLLDTLATQPVIDFWLTHCENMTIADALAWYALRDSQDDLGDSEDSVTLLTCHAAKGLEWPAVIVVDLNEGEFPSQMAIREEGVEEERRLAYVAITRAREWCTLHYRRPEDQSPERRPKAVSRFVEEAKIC